MNIKESIQNLSNLTRSDDWRLSLVPLVLGCTYFWAVLLKIEFTLDHFLVIALSYVTSFGFAAMGYFINEFFDQAHDKKAGKINKLSLIAPKYQLTLLLGILLFTLVPWIYLPKNNLSYVLIITELLLFLIYSLPFIRLKETFFFAGIIDTMYAYIVPAVLSYHTYSFLSQSTISLEYLSLFFLLLFVVGYRNILVHQIKDVMGDIRSKTKSLPQLLGPDLSNKFLHWLVLFELLLMSLTLIWFSINVWQISLFIAALILFIYQHKSSLKQLLVFDGFFALKKVRQSTDVYYQKFFPVASLVLLICVDPYWLVIAPMHWALFVNLNLKNRYHTYVRPVLSSMINYSIYYMFLLFGVNLKERQVSAINFLKSKFKR